MDFSKLKVQEKTGGGSVPATVIVDNDTVTITFDLETDKAKLTKTGKEYFINFSGTTNADIDNRACHLRAQGNIFIR